jgi:hypothetical protein
LTEETAHRVVDRCADEAKIVAVEQEKKKAEQAAAAKQGPKFDPADEAVRIALGLRGVDAVAGGERPMPQVPSAATAVEAEPAIEESEGSKMPGPMESAGGGAPEIMVHKATETVANGELSPEEEGMQGIETEPGGGASAKLDEESDPAALAEGRTEPPVGDR